MNVEDLNLEEITTLLSRQPAHKAHWFIMSPRGQNYFRKLYIEQHQEELETIQHLRKLESRKIDDNIKRYKEQSDEKASLEQFILSVGQQRKDSLADILGL